MYSKPGNYIVTQPQTVNKVNNDSMMNFCGIQHAPGGQFLLDWMVAIRWVQNLVLFKIYGTHFSYNGLDSLNSKNKPIYFPSTGGS